MFKYLLSSAVILILVFGYLNFTKITLAAPQATPCPTGSFSEGLVTGGSLSNVSTVKGNCISGNEVAYDVSDLPSYQTLKKTYYEKAKANGFLVKKPIVGTVNETSINNNDTLANPPIESVIFNVTGDLNINNNFANTKNTKLIFVDGNLYIGDSTNLSNPFSTGTDFIYDNPQGGVIFIVQGSINVDSRIVKLDAVLISSGVKPDKSNAIYTICTSYDGNCMSLSQNEPTDRLVVNGSLISLNPDIAITFSRNNPNTLDVPAELVNQQPKFLVILKDMLTSTLEIRTEE